MKIALAMIVRGTDEEAKLLERCLQTIAPYVDGIFITRTQPNDAVAKVAKKYKAHLSDFEWCNDFAAARNFNFSQVPKDYDYIMWSDADDAWRGLEKLKDTLAAHPHIDGFGIWYLYDWDEFKKPTVVHKKTMIVKNDGGTRWVGALHEDMEPNRAFEVHVIEGIERCHLTTKERHDENAKRNLEIAVEAAKVKPDDPRSFWNLGNSQYAVSKYAEAIDTFEHFIETTESDDEKYLAYSRLADCYRGLDRRQEAIKQLQLAIGLYPTLPDGFYQLAYLYFSFGNYDKAEEYVLQGMVRKPMTNRMIVFNPRDYDYNPMMLLAKIYYHKNRPDLMLPMLKGCLKIYPTDDHLKKLVKEGEGEYKAMEKALKRAEKLLSIKDKEKLKQELDRLPTALKSHPTIAALRNTNFIKQTSSGRDLVIYCGNTQHQWNPELFKIKGFGGSEEAVINLSRELAKLGWNVTVYNNCGHKPLTEIVSRLTPAKFAQVEYRPFWEWNYRDKQDVTILWRWCKPLDAEINSSKIFVDLHDVVPEGEFTTKRLLKVTKIMVKTQFHRSLFPNVPDEKIAVIPNGMDFALLESDPPIKKDPYLIINTSSPDRSMDVLPALFREVKKRIPQARLQWAYGWEVFKASFASDTKKLDWMKQTQKQMDDAGIETLGRLTQAEVGKLYQQASFLAYPTEFAEIDCISVKKAQAAGARVVATDFGALPESTTAAAKLIHSSKTKETWNKPYQFHFGLEGQAAQHDWVEAMVEVLKGNRWNESVTRQWSHQFEWPRIAARWNDILKA